MTLEELNEVTAEFPETKEFIEERLEQKFSKKIYQWMRLFFFLLA